MTAGPHLVPRLVLFEEEVVNSESWLIWVDICSQSNLEQIFWKWKGFVVILFHAHLLSLKSPRGLNSSIRMPDGLEGLSLSPPFSISFNRNMFCAQGSRRQMTEDQIALAHPQCRSFLFFFSQSNLLWHVFFFSPSWCLLDWFLFSTQWLTSTVFEKGWQKIAKAQLMVQFMKNRSASCFHGGIQICFSKSVQPWFLPVEAPIVRFYCSVKISISK